MTNLTAIIAGGGTVPTWVSGTAYVVDDDVFSPASGHLYRCIVDTSGTTDPSADSTNWKMIGSAGIKSVQRGTISIDGASASGTATITAVVTAKSDLSLLGFKTEGGADATHSPYLVLSNTTTVTAYRRQAGTSGDLTVVSWQIVEAW